MTTLKVTKHFSPFKVLPLGKIPYPKDIDFHQVKIVFDNSPEVLKYQEYTIP